MFCKFVRLLFNQSTMDIVYLRIVNCVLSVVFGALSSVGFNALLARAPWMSETDRQAAPLIPEREHSFEGGEWDAIPLIYLFTGKVHELGKDGFKGCVGNCVYEVNIFKY